MGLRRHRTMALEQRTLMNYQGRRRNVAQNLRRGTNLDAMRRGDIAAHFARDDYRISLDLGSDDSALTDRQAVLGVDFAVNLAIDTRRCLEAELTADFRTCIEIRARAATRHRGRLR